MGNKRLWLKPFYRIRVNWDKRLASVIFDNNIDLYAINIVEVRRRHTNLIAPRCYGAFKGHGVDGLILDLCDDVLSDWG